MNLKAFYNRDDIKWSHPEIETAYAEASQSFGATETIFNDDIPIEERREYCDKFANQFADLIHYDEDRTKVYEVPGCPEEPDAPLVKLTVVQPPKVRKKKYPCILCIPGGGLAMCMPTSAPIQEFSNVYKCVSATFDYRLCLRGGKYPETINDCHAVYKFIYDHAEEMNIDREKIVIFGDSSGAHLALALCHRLKKYGYQPRGCAVWAPIIDDRMIYPSSKIQSASWAGEQLNASCKTWLGKIDNPAYVPAEAFANRATVEECVGLPPTIIHTFVNDACYDPCLQYASKLGEAGVYVSLHAWGGSNHDALVTSNMIYGESSSILNAGETDVRYVNTFNTVVRSDFKDLLEYDLRRPWTKEMVEEK